MFTIMILALTYLFASIPFHTVIPWCRNRIQDIQDKMAKPETLVHRSGSAFGFFLIQSLNFAKGFAPLFLVPLVWDTDFTWPLLALLVLVGHIWSPFTRFEPQKNIDMLLWGMLACLSPLPGACYPLIFLGLSIILNSFVMGRAITLILTLIWIGISYYWVGTIYAGTLITFLSIGIFFQDLLNHFEKEPLSLLRSFQNR